MEKDHGAGSKDRRGVGTSGKGAEDPPWSFHSKQPADSGTSAPSPTLTDDPGEPSTGRAALRTLVWSCLGWARPSSGWAGALPRPQ